MKHKRVDPTRHVGLVATLTLSLGLIVAFLLLAGSTAGPALAQSGTGTLRVAKTHANAQNIATCGSEITPCLTIQYAVDRAQSDEDVLVAAGTYTGVNSHGGKSQIIYIIKALNLMGGYTYTNWAASDPDLYPTIIDAERNGRGIMAKGDIEVTIEGLEITGGDATGLSAGSEHYGGGVYADVTGLVISDCQVYDNLASDSEDGQGGGVYALGGSQREATVYNCDVYSNTAASPTGNEGYGGGLFFDMGSVTLEVSRILSNTAAEDDIGYGGGIGVSWANLTMTGNLLRNNTAATGDHGYGGAVHTRRYTITLDGNTIISNTASTAGIGQGGGVAVESARAVTLTGNTISDNKASTAPQKEGAGGGVSCSSSKIATLEGNTISGNTASEHYYGYGGGLFYVDEQLVATANNFYSNTASANNEGYGGGLCLMSTNATLMGNKILGNVAASQVLSPGLGGGIWASYEVEITMTNNLVAGNWASTKGDGLLFSGSSPSDFCGTLVYNTIADNQTLGETGEGIVIDGYAELVMTDTIISGHDGYGLVVNSDAKADLEATLWYSNGENITGTGTVTTGTVDLEGNPAFADPTKWDYHLTVGSAAIDQGLDAGIYVDLDVAPRPALGGFDIGAYEFPYGVSLTPDRMGYGDPGDVVTYTHTLTNEGDVTDTYTLSHGSDLGWAVTYASPVTLATGVTQTVVFSVQVPGDALSGTIETTIMTATSHGGPSAVASVTDGTTVLRVVGAGLGVDGAQMAAPREVVTYTHTLANTGNSTDTFSLQVDSSQGWAAVDPGPHVLSAWATQTLVVTLQTPGDALSGTVETTVVTATSGADPAKKAAVMDETTVLRVVGVGLTPGRAATAAPREVVTYTHTLTNTGNWTDTLKVEAASSQGWAVVGAGAFPLAPGLAASLVVTISVPATATDGTVDTTVVTATSSADAMEYAMVTDTTTVKLAVFKVYLPVVLKNQ